MRRRASPPRRAFGLRLAAVGSLVVVAACGHGGGGGPSSPPLLDIVPGTVDVTVDRGAAERTLAFSDEAFLPTDCAVVEGATQAGVRRLLRFDTVVINHGALPMTLGDPDNPASPLLASDFESAPCHGHHHFLGWARYDLATAGGAVVVAGHKQSFCLIDNVLVVGGSSSLGFDCDFQGLSSGWGDVYDHTTDGQWVDVTGVAEGDYELVITVNAAGKIVEVDNRWPNVVRIPVHVPSPATPLP